jgi:hypothetical protein
MFELPTKVTERPQAPFTGVFVPRLSERVINRMAAWKQLHLNKNFAKMPHSAPVAFD